MQSGYHNRLGRPPKPPRELPVEPIAIIGGRVPPHNCPFCCKGQDPEIIARELQFTRVRCRSCARAYKYVPAKILAHVD